MLHFSARTVLAYACSLGAGIVATYLCFGCVPAAFADRVTARTIEKELSLTERYAYVTGVIEALAYARYLREKPSRRGMDCITGWYQKTPRIAFWSEFEALTKKHGDQPVSVLIYAMSIDHCGE